MIPAIVIGKAISRGFPGKNIKRVFDKEMMLYPVEAAIKSENVGRVFFTTDSRYMAELLNNKAPEVVIVDDPRKPNQIGEDVFVHTYNEIKRFINDIEYVVLMFANAPCITSYMIDHMIEIIRETPFADSICTVSKYNMFSPYRARKISKVMRDSKYSHPYGRGYLMPFCPDLVDKATCDRDSGQDNYIYDCSCAVVRPGVLENIEDQPQPQRWLGSSIIPHKQYIPALDVDFEWQMGQIEYWLRKNRSLL